MRRLWSKIKMFLFLRGTFPFLSLKECYIMLFDPNLLPQEVQDALGVLEAGKAGIVSATNNDTAAGTAVAGAQAALADAQTNKGSTSAALTTAQQTQVSDLQVAVTAIGAWLASAAQASQAP